MIELRGVGQLLGISVLAVFVNAEEPEWCGRPCPLERLVTGHGGPVH
jgi:hypothetical protein